LTASGRGLARIPEGFAWIHGASSRWRVWRDFRAASVANVTQFLAAEILL
jgi:hypothetical protein